MAEENAVLALHPYEVFRRELTVKGSFAQTHCFDRALGVLRSGRVRTDGIVTNEFHLSNYDERARGVAERCLLSEGGNRPLTSLRVSVREGAG